MPSFSFSLLFPFSALVDLPHVRPWEIRRRPARPPSARALGRGTSTVRLASRRDPPLRLPPSSLPPNPPCAGGRSAALPSSGLRARSRRPECRAPPLQRPAGSDAAAGRAEMTTVNTTASTHAWIPSCYPPLSISRLLDLGAGEPCLRAD